MFKSIGRLALSLLIATSSIAPVQLSAMNGQEINGNVSFLSKSCNHLKSAANYVLATAKSDLGFISLEEAKKEAEDNASLHPLNNLKRQFLKASRLYIYQFIVDTALQSCIKLPESAVQFKKNLSFKLSVIVAPILEETIFTRLSVGLFGKKALILSPLLFGLAHMDPSYHKNLKYIIFSHTALMSTLHTRLFHYDRGEFLVCVMHHMINNAIANLYNKNNSITNGD